MKKLFEFLMVGMELFGHDMNAHILNVFHDGNLI